MPGGDLRSHPRFTFEGLISSIQATDQYFRSQALRAVNLALTLRNWCFGWYIAEFELQGADRARYGERLLAELSSELKQLGISNVGRRQLYQYLTFYRVYPEIVRSLPAQFHGLLPHSADLQEKVRTLSAQSTNPPQALVDRLSYSHFELLIGLEDDLKRGFYETESIRGQWSVRELRRQIGSLLFERTGLSTDKASKPMSSGMSISASSIPMSTGSASTSESRETTHLLVCFSVPARITLWSNTPWLAWIASSLSPTTKWNYQKRKTWSASWRQS